MAVAGALFALPAASTAGYLAAAWIGGLVPGPVRDAGYEPRDVEIVVLEGLLHTDILLRATGEVRETFGFAREQGVPIDAPGLQWLSVGWGSRAFYTTAGSYSDIEPSAVWKAVTGDDAVLRVVGFGALVDGPDVRRLRVTRTGYERLLAFVRATLSRGPVGRPIPVNASLQPGDAFYEAKGRFHIFNPCNEWTRKVLNQAGVQTGAWTPTTFSLAGSLERYAF